MSKDGVENLKKGIFFFFPKRHLCRYKIKKGKKKKRVFSVITEKKLFKKR